MNCQNIKDELLLLAGGALTDELQAHLNDCPDCRAYWSELTDITENLGSDEEFYLDDNALKASIARVDQRIDQLELEKVTDVRSAWLSYVPAVAAVVLLFGISVAVYMLGWFGSDNGQAGITTPDTTWVTLENGDMDIFEEGSIDYVIYQSATSGELLYEDITEEELQYLNENFDVGEIM